MSKLIRHQIKENCNKSHTYSSLYLLISYSLFIFPLFITLLATISLFSMSGFCFCFIYEFIWVIFTFHTYVVSYGISFSLTYFIKHSIILAPTLLLQMAIFHSLLWLSNIPYYMYVCVYAWDIYIYIFLRHLPKPVICWWVLVLLLCLGNCKWCCYEHWGVCSKECFQ